MTFYSLRHTYICFRLIDRADIHPLAKNCRTSVEMIQKFYASQSRICWTPPRSMFGSHASGLTPKPKELICLPFGSTQVLLQESRLPALRESAAWRARFPR
jgi:hypothetical protein